MGVVKVDLRQIAVEVAPWLQFVGSGFEKRNIFVLELELRQIRVDEVASWLQFSAEGTILGNRAHELDPWLQFFGLRYDSGKWSSRAQPMPAIWVAGSRWTPSSVCTDV